MKTLFTSSPTTILKALKEKLDGNSSLTLKNPDSQNKTKTVKRSKCPIDNTLRKIRALPSFTKTPCHLPNYSFAKPLSGIIFIQSPDDPDAINVYHLTTPSYRLSEIQIGTDNNSNPSLVAPVMKMGSHNGSAYLIYYADGKVFRTLTGKSAISNIEGLKSSCALSKKSATNLDELIIDLKAHEKLFDTVKQNKKSELESKGALETGEEAEIILERNRSLTNAMDPDIFTELENSYVDIYPMTQSISNNNSTNNNKAAINSKQTWQKCLVRCMSQPKNETLGLQLTFVDKNENPTNIFIGRTAQKFIEDNLLNPNLNNEENTSPIFSF